MVANLLGLEEGRAIIGVEDYYRSTALDYAMHFHLWKIVGVLRRHHTRRRPLKTVVWVRGPIFTECDIPTVCQNGFGV